jgi:hypothetical protein
VNEDQPELGVGYIVQSAYNLVKTNNRQKSSSMKTFIKAFHSFEEAEAWDIAYWNAQSPGARLRAAEKLRRQLYGRPPKKLSRILTTAKRA